MKQIKDILALKKSNSLIVVYPDSKLLEIVDRMMYNNVHHVVIVERDTEKEIDGIKSPGRIVGMVSDRDLSLALNTSMLSKDVEAPPLDQVFGEFVKQLDENKVDQIMNTHVYCKDAEASAQEVIRTMKSLDINSIPVVAKDTKYFIGMVTKSDMMDLLLDYITKEDSKVVGTA
jgi:CBS domain-containing protein